LRKKATILFVTACSLAITLGGHRNGLSQPAPCRIEIVARRFAFSPAEITVKKGEPVLLVLSSQDVGHGLRFRELNVDVKIPKNGGTAQVQFTPELTGDFIGHCSIFCGTGHGSMALTLHVVP
jgi:cytochrome c oxidase subunit 2